MVRWKASCKPFRPGLRSRKVSEVYGWIRSRIPNKTGSRSRLFCPTPDLRLDHFLDHTSIGNFCWNGTISFKNFVETEISCCVPRFPLILTAKFHSLYVKESGVEVGNFGKVGIGTFVKSDILPPTPEPWFRHQKLTFPACIFVILSF